MARLLMVANDPGGANVLAAVAPTLMARGHTLTCAGGPPALQVWRAASLTPIAASPAGEWIAHLIASTAPELVITGTSEVSDLERLTWIMAHQKAVPTLAAIDAWTCYGRRTELSDGRKSLPDAFAVADQTMVRGLADDGLGAVRVHEVGQPHLQALGERLGRRRTPRRSKRLLLAFFSEGIREAQPGPKSPGYDQFTVAELLIGALSGLGPIDLHIVPHPLEEAANWREFLSAFPLGRDLSLVSGSLGRDDALCTADGILGMTSMVLVEAALVGAPFLSLQPGRTRSANPFLDSLAGVLVVTDAASTATAVSTFIQRLESQITPLQIPATDNAIRRFAAAVEAELRGSAHLVVQLATS